MIHTEQGRMAQKIVINETMLATCKKLEHHYCFGFENDAPQYLFFFIPRILK